MPVTGSRPCGCPRCQQGLTHPDREYHRGIILLMGQIPPLQRRLFAAIESKRLGHGGCQLVFQITGIWPATVSRGRAELGTLLAGMPLERPKGRRGRHSIRKKYPEIERVLEELLADDTGGDPMNRRKGVRVSGRKLSKRLAEKGYTVNHRTVCQLLKQMGYSMKVNVRHRASTSNSPERDSQFQYIAQQKATFLAAGNPVVRSC